MYAVVSSGGKQYRVEPGATLTVERLTDDVGASITFYRVLVVGDGETVMVGTPVVSGATVRGTILGPASGAKIVVFKFKQKVKYRRRTGHRQQLTRIRIDEISADGRTARAEPAAATKPPKPAEPAKAAKPAKGSAATADKPSRAPERAARGDAPGADEEGTEKKPAPRRRATRTTEPKE